MVRTRVVGRHPSGSCANRRVRVSRGDPSHAAAAQPIGLDNATGPKAARSGASRCPVTSRPSSSSRQNTVRSGRAESPHPGERQTRRGLPAGLFENSHLRKASTLPGHRRAENRRPRHHTTVTPSSVKSLVTLEAPDFRQVARRTGMTWLRAEPSSAGDEAVTPFTRPPLPGLARTRQLVVRSNKRTFGRNVT